MLSTIMVAVGVGLFVWALINIVTLYVRFAKTNLSEKGSGIYGRDKRNPKV